MIAIKVKYLPWTETKPSRVAISCRGGEGQIKRMVFSHSRSNDTNAIASVMKFIAEKLVLIDVSEYILQFSELETDIDVVTFVPKVNTWKYGKAQKAFPGDAAEIERNGLK